MSIRIADNSWDHLYLPFRQKLRVVKQQVEAATGQPWEMSEGYRSPQRQLWLYAQGRTRPGKVVTWMRSPKWHGTGLAADMLPSRDGYGAPHTMWETYREIYHRQGLENPAWTNGDLGHCQLTDYHARALALVWVRAGFPAEAVAAAPSGDVRVLVDGDRVPDAEGTLRPDGRTWVRLRPVTDALDLVIVRVANGKATIADDNSEWEVPIEMQAGHAYAKLNTLPCSLSWDAASKTARLSR